MFNFLKNKEIKNAGWIIGERVVQTFLSLIIGVISARYLGPGNYGALNYTASLVTFFSSVALLGMDGVIIKKMISQPEEEGSYLGGCMLLRLFSSVLCSVVIVVLVLLLNPDDKTKMILAFLQSLQLIFQSVSILDSWFQRYLKSKYISICKIIAFLIMSGYKIILIVFAKSIEWFAFANSLSFLVIAILLLVFYFKNQGKALKFNIKLGVDVLKDSYHYILSGLMVALYSQMDKIMIGKMLSDFDVGLYATATAICGMWVFIPTAIINSFRPTILEFRQSGNMKQYSLRLRQLYSVIIWLCIGISAIVCVFAPLIIEVLYGEEYSGAVGALRIAIWFETFSMIGTARGIWILSEDKNKYIKYYLAIGVVVNFVLNLILIPVFGINGAAFATLITQVVTSIISPMFFKATREHTGIVLDAFCLKWYFDKKSNQNK